MKNNCLGHAGACPVLLLPQHYQNNSLLFKSTIHYSLCIHTFHTNKILNIKESRCQKYGGKQQ